MEALTTMRVAKSKAVKLKRWDSPIAGYLFISPGCLDFFTLTLYPMIQSLYYSFTDFSLLEEPSWVGLRNYQKIVTTDDRFIQSVKVTFLYVLGSVPLRLVAALFIAILLAKSLKGMSAYRTAIYFPSMIGGSIAVSLLWKKYFRQDRIHQSPARLFGHRRHRMGDKSKYCVMDFGFTCGLAVRFGYGHFPCRPQTNP